MASEAQQIIDTIIAKKSCGNPVIASSIRTKLALKGINLKSCADGETGPDIIQTLRAIAAELGVPL